MGREVPAVHTPSSADELLEANGRAYFAQFGRYPSRGFCLCLLGQWAGETGSGKFEWNYNIGNEQGSASSVYDYEELNAWEMVNGRRVPMREKFRAFPTLDEAVAEHIAFLSTGNGGRYAAAFARAEADDPHGFAQQLHAAGYYTQIEQLYEASVVHFFNAFASLPLAPWELDAQDAAAPQTDGPPLPGDPNEP